MMQRRVHDDPKTFFIGSQAQQQHWMVCHRRHLEEPIISYIKQVLCKNLKKFFKVSLETSHTKSDLTVCRTSAARLWASE